MVATSVMQTKGPEVEVDAGTGGAGGRERRALVVTRMVAGECNTHKER
jgi:hypothetical protein